MIDIIEDSPQWSKKSRDTIIHTGRGILSEDQ